MSLNRTRTKNIQHEIRETRRGRSVIALWDAKNLSKRSHTVDLECKFNPDSKFVAANITRDVNMPRFPKDELFSSRDRPIVWLHPTGSKNPGNTKIRKTSREKSIRSSKMRELWTFLPRLLVPVVRKARLARDGCSKYTYLHFKNEITLYFFSLISKISIIPHAFFLCVLIARAWIRTREKYAFPSYHRFHRTPIIGFTELSRIPINERYIDDSFITVTVPSKKRRSDGKCSRAIITADLMDVTRFDETR